MKKKKGFFAEFKEFISRGNVIDMAVGVIVGSAFTAIVNSLVKDVITPVIGLILGGIDLSKHKFILTPAIGDIPENAILYGSFIQNIINFIIISFVVFLMVKFINRLRSKKEEPAPEPEAPPAPSEETVLLTEIRDLLKKDSKN